MRCGPELARGVHTTDAVGRYASPREKDVGMPGYDGFLDEATLVDDAHLSDACCCWSVSPDVYPRRGDPTAKLVALVRWAVLAPSSHNTQPWSFRVTEGHLEVRADRHRGLAVIDPDDRALTLSCGAALEHLRIAMARFGNEADVRLLPREDDPDLLATVSFGRACSAAPTEVALFDAIPKRRTNRAPFLPTLLEESLLDALFEHADARGVRATFLTTHADKAAFAELVAEGDARQMADKRFRRELAAWMRPNASRARDGIPGHALGFRDLASLVGPLVVRTFDVGQGEAAKDRALAEGSPAIVVLSTDRDDELSWLAAGQALARILLCACSDGVWASFLSQPIEVPELRRTLAERTGGGHPQLALRLGRSLHTPKPTPRRSADETLDR